MSKHCWSTQTSGNNFSILFQNVENIYLDSIEIVKLKEKVLASMLMGFTYPMNDVLITPIIIKE